MSLRVLIAVTHLLGVGHLARVAAIARGLAQAGHDVTLISGGTPAPLIAMEGVRLIQLPPVHIKGTSFSTLLGEDGAPLSETVRQERQQVMIDTVREILPHVVITELFPFGRRALADEFMAFVDASRALDPRPAIVCSIRDVLVPPLKQQRVDETHSRLSALYDGVMVHGDAAVLPLERSWPVRPDIKHLLHYTGYIDDAASSVQDTNGTDTGEILVSGGGSAASLPLYRTAIEASRLITDRNWRILVGRGVHDDAFNALLAAAPAHVVVERARSDFPALLARAALSVSQAGYNTIIDVLRARVRAVVVPFEAGNETEQRLRAESFASAGIWPLSVLPEIALSSHALAEAIINTLKQDIPLEAPISRNGVAASVAMVEHLASVRQLPYPALSRALNEVMAAGRKVKLWWRDDDAIATTPALERLLALSEQHAVPVAIAAVPEYASEALAQRLAEAPLTTILVHGLAHTNHAPVTEKKAEFGSHRPLPVLMADAQEALHLARARFGEALMPVFVPPWNRISAELVPQMKILGYCGVSTAGKAKSFQDVIVANTHIDPIAWHDGGGLLPPSEIDTRAAEQLRNALDDNAPIVLGLLTHHLVHDDATWTYISGLLAWLTSHPAIEVIDAHQLFNC